MSDSIKWLLWLLGLILLLWLSFFNESCRQAGWETILCSGCAETTPVAPPVVEPEVISRLPVDCEKNKATAFTNDGYQEYKERLVQGFKDDQVLEITGDYYEGETSPEGFENIGLARASAFRDLITAEIADEKIVLKSNMIKTNIANIENQFFKCHNYEWVTVETKPAAVEEIDGCTIVRFAFNSDDGNLDNKIVESLDKIASRVSKTGENIVITGHTDNIGDNAYNTRLGRNRARDIRREFINRNVLREQITIQSRGEDKPIASNDDDLGRAKNRRVEICLNE